MAYLTEKNIIYETQKTFQECRDKQVLPFDFFIDNKFLLEYDGNQHFRPYIVFGGEERFKLQQLHDHIKNKYCFKNKIKLLRISYNELNNIYKILDDYISNFNQSNEIITFSNAKIYENMRIKIYSEG